MLSLKKSSEFQRLFKSGKWYGDGVLSIYIEKNSKDSNRVGVAVGRKIAKSVKRNRIKRLIKESYRIHEKEINQGYNIIVVCKKDIDVEKINFNEIEKNLVSCLEKASLMSCEIN